MSYETDNVGMNAFPETPVWGAIGEPVKEVDEAIPNLPFSAMGGKSGAKGGSMGLEVERNQNSPEEPEKEDPHTKASTNSAEDKKAELTPEQIKTARMKGRDAVDMLAGYTTRSEQRAVRDIVYNDVNSDNVMEFLKGYQEGKAVGKNFMANRFFEQLGSEYSYDENQDIMHKTAKDLQKHLADKYGVDYGTAKEIEVILQSSVISREQAKKLDHLYGAELGEL